MSNLTIGINKIILLFLDILSLFIIILLLLFSNGLFLFLFFVFYLILFYIIEKNIYKHGIKQFIFKKTSILLSFLIFFTLFSYLYIKFFPLTSYYVVFENKKLGKEVIFRGMSHIASENFYNKIKEEIKEKTNDGYVYYYEGVKSKNKDDIELLEKETGIKPKPEEYLKKFKFKDIKSQNQKELNMYAKKSKNVDVYIEDILKKKKELGINDNIILKNVNKQSFNLSLQKYNSLSPIIDIYKEMSITIGNRISSLSLINKSNSKKFFSDIILDYRNKHLCNEIIKSNDKKIYINYGNLHFKGISNILKENGFVIKETNNNLKFY